MEKVDDIKKTIQDCLDKTASFLKLKNGIRDKEVTILLGQTKCGKSTLANYLLGTDLRSVQDDLGVSYELEMLDTNQGPQITNGVVSGTNVATIYTTPDGEVLIDSPGFEDNRGIQQDIFNCLCIHQIRFAKSLKFVFLCYIGDLLSHNVQNFTKLLKQMTDLVPDIEDINKSWCIIFTKDKDNITPDMLRTKIKNRILNENDFKTDKKLLPILIGNKNSIGIFKAPTKEGVTTFKELDVNVKDAIHACDYTPVKKFRINFALAKDSIDYLGKIQKYYTKYFNLKFVSEIERTIEDHINYFDIDLYVHAAYGNELRELEDVLDSLSENLIEIRENAIGNLGELKFTLEALLHVKNLKLSLELESNFQFILSLDNASLIDPEFKDDVIQIYKKSIIELLKMIQKICRKITAENQTREEEYISLIYEEDTFASTGNLAAATFGGVRARIASLTGALGLAGTYLGITVESSALVTAAVTSVTSIGTILVGGVLLVISCRVKDSLVRRYKIRCRQNR